MNTPKILLTTLSLSILATLTGCPTNNDNNGSNNTSTTPDETPDTTLADTTKDTVEDTAQDTSTGECADVTVYADKDEDGKGDDALSKQVCLKPAEQEAGYVREGGDCNDSDALVFDGADGVCGDNVDDDCDNSDEVCPTSMASELDIPEWDCSGDAPANVVAVARAGDQAFYNAGSCFVFFEAAKGTFYVKRTGFERSMGGDVCDQAGVGGYDNRLYAFTKSDAPDCEEIVLSKSGDNPVSNACRKYLYHMPSSEMPFSFVASSLDSLKARLDNFGTVEVACVRDTTLSSTAFPFKTVLSTPIEYVDSYVAK